MIYEKSYNFFFSLSKHIGLGSLPNRSFEQATHIIILEGLACSRFDPYNSFGFNVRTTVMLIVIVAAAKANTDERRSRVRTPHTPRRRNIISSELAARGAVPTVSAGDRR